MSTILYQSRYAKRAAFSENLDFCEKKVLCTFLAANKCKRSYSQNERMTVGGKVGGFSIIEVRKRFPAIRQFFRNQVKDHV